MRVAPVTSGRSINPYLDFLLSVLYDFDPLHAEHLADLRRSGLTDDTVRLQKLRSVPPGMIPQLLGFDVPAVRSAYLIPFPDPSGGFMDHIRVKIFPPHKNRQGNTVKYLQPRGSAVRLFLPLAMLDLALHGDGPLWAIEGEKKALAVAQLGLPAFGFCGIEGWHVAGSRELIPDFSCLRLRGRVVEFVPDGDVSVNVNVQRGAEHFAEALEDHGARVRLVQLPVRVAAA